jgi:N-acetylglucosaminyldiphosphoundecaprenol N-acetyl-beta-D-mannosaminyltransferase
MIDTDLSLIDGAPLVALAKMLGAPIKERCAGSDVFEALRRRPGFPGRRIRVFFFGGRDGAAEAAAAAITAEGRGVEAAGFYNPGSGDVASMSTPDVIERVNAAGPDFVLVALGAEKGQAWIDANRASLAAPVVAHLGAVVDFTAGSIGRAPASVRRIGLEWAWRIKEEPALWRRYADDARSFAGILVKAAPTLAARAAPAKKPATADLRAGAANAVVRLGGDLVAGDLGAVRQAFRAAAKTGSDVVLDFGAAGAIDAAFLGLVLMLEKRLRESGATILVADLGRRHRRILAAHAMPYAAAELANRATDAAPDRGIAAAV